MEKQTLIHDGSKPGWPEWFIAQNALQSGCPTQGLYFDHAYLAVQAAIGGDGVALVSEPLVDDAIAGGRLICPSSYALHGFGAYYLVTPLGVVQEPKISIFRDWLLAERSAQSYNLSRMELEASEFDAVT
ncbi:hypothetical protein HB780_00045 (plasmid) [Rhizobium lusitanum]|nr:hypothetical protein HB780_00045 [Rhizobium lusitanum]